MPRRTDRTVDLIAIPAECTWSDRLGPDVGRVIRACAFGALVTVVVALFAVTLRFSGATRAPMPGMLLGAVVIGALAAGEMLLLSDAAGAGFLAFIQPSGASTPYQRDYSYQEALAVSGDVDGAVASYVALIAGAPADVEARVALAELYARSGHAVHAAATFIELRRVPGASAHRDLYATSRLADLYGGPLAQPGRALVELRRLAETHPHTREATFARSAIARLKEESGARL